MKVSTSILNLEDYQNNLPKLESSNTDYIHLDIIDGKFATNKKEYFIDNMAKPVDIHLMVEDVKSYVDQYSYLKPEYMTFHIEVGNTLEYINYIKNKGIRVGIAVDLDTAIDDIVPYLDKVDLVLVMCVKAGKGGQSFDKSVLLKIEQLSLWKEKYHYQIEVDGGINDQTIHLVDKADIVVSGTYITGSNSYDMQIQKLKNKMTR